MTLAIDPLIEMLKNIGILSTGLAFSIVGLILGITRSSTKNSDHWAILFGVLSWTIATMITNMPWAGLIFGIGTIGIVMSVMPLIEKMGDNSIFGLAIMFGILNFIIVIGMGAFTMSLSWQTNYDASITQIETLIGTQLDTLEQGTPEIGLCSPNEINEDGTNCEPDTISGTFNPSLFVPFASILTIGTYIGKAIAFIGMVLLAPLILGTIMASNGMIANPIIGLLISFIIILMQMATFYKLILFMLDRRGIKA